MIKRILGWVLIAIGFFVFFTTADWVRIMIFLPPDDTTTVWALIVGIGTLSVVLLALGTRLARKKPLDIETRLYHGKVCGNCIHFGRESCRRKEKQLNAMPCEEYMRGTDGELARHGQ